MLGLDPALGTRAAVRRAAARAGRRGRRPSAPTCRRRPGAASCRSAPTAASPTTTASAATSARSRTRGAPRCGSPPSASPSPTSPTRRRCRCAIAGRRRWSSTTRAGRRGVPRDVGAGLGLRRRARPLSRGCSSGSTRCALRSIDHERYLELSRAVDRRGDGRGVRRVAPRRLALRRRARAVAARPAARAPGWGVLDHRGRPKVAYHHLRRALAPVAVWTTDEGLGGIVVHVANDRPAAAARRRCASRSTATSRCRSSEATRELALAPHAHRSAQRRGAARALRRRLVGLSLRAAGRTTWSC